MMMKKKNYCSTNERFDRNNLEWMPLLRLLGAKDDRHSGGAKAAAEARKEKA